MTDRSANVIDLAAYRAQRTAAGLPGGAASQPNVYQGAFYCFWPMMVWMPIPVAMTTLSRDAL